MANIREVVRTILLGAMWIVILSTPAALVIGLTYLVELWWSRTAAQAFLLGAMGLMFCGVFGMFVRMAKD